MTVSSTISRSGPYTGNGATTVFDYDFRILEDAHLTVVRTVDGVDAIVNPSDYSVTGVGSAEGGTIVFTLAPATGQAITIIRNAPFTQEIDLENQGEFFAETIERGLDLAAMRDQQLEERLDRAVTIPVGANPETLAELVGDIIQVSDNFANIDAVAGSIGSVNAVAPHVQVISDNVEAITTVSENIGDITALAVVRSFDTRADAAAAVIASGVDAITLAGFLSAGDGGGALYKRAVAQPSHAGKFQSADGAWWELAEREISPLHFGIVVAPADASANVQAALDTASALGRPVLLPSETLWVKNLTVPAGAVIRGVPGKSVLKCLTGATQMMSHASGTLRIRDVTLDGNSQAVRALVCTSSSGVEILDCNVANWGAVNYVLDFLMATSNIKVRGGRMSDCTADTILSFRGSYNQVEGVTFANMPGHAVRFGRYNIDSDAAAGVYDIVDGCQFSNVANDAVLAELDSRYVTVTNCIAERVRRLFKGETTDAAGPTTRLVISNNIATVQIVAASDGVSKGECIKTDNVLGAIVTGNNISGFEIGITYGAQSIVANNYINGTTAGAIGGTGINTIIANNNIKSDTSTYAIVTLDSRTKITGNSIGTTGTCIRLGGARAIVTGNDCAGAVGVSMVSGAVNSIISQNDLSASTTTISGTATGTTPVNNNTA